MCFDFRRARSHPLGPTITSRIPGRFAMYTPEEAHVKVLTCSLRVLQFFPNPPDVYFLPAFSINDWWTTNCLNRAGQHKRRPNEIPRRECFDHENQKPEPKYVDSVVGVLWDRYAPR
jgi:hypothetical protein